MVVISQRTRGVWQSEHVLCFTADSREGLTFILNWKYSVLGFFPSVFRNLVDFFLLLAAWLVNTPEQERFGLWEPKLLPHPSLRWVFAGRGWVGGEDAQHGFGDTQTLPSLDLTLHIWATLLISYFYLCRTEGNLRITRLSALGK